jgi:hypothetical protein
VLLTRHTDVFLQVLAYVGIPDFHWDTRRRQDIRVADARKFQELRRLNAPSTEDHLPSGCCIIAMSGVLKTNACSDPLPVAILELNPFHQGVREED